MPETSSDSQLGSIIGWRKVMRFALPSILMMMFISSYSIVDGAFISNYVDTDALASLNIMYPLFSLVSAIGFMFATGGSAYVSNLFGKGRPDDARAAFSQIMLISAALSIAFTVVGFIFLEPIALILGADGTLLDGCVRYTSVYLPFTVFLVMQFITTQFLVVAEKPSIALYTSIAAGVTNIVLDYVFIVIMDWGLEGAAVASGLGSVIPTAIALYLFTNRSMSVHFTKPASGMKAIGSSVSNGISEMVSEISGGIITLCYNLVMMHYIGPDGVTAISIISYVQFLAISAVIGYSNGVAPVMSYFHGAGDRANMHRLFRTSTAVILVMSAMVFMAMELFSGTVAGFFADASESVMELIIHGSAIYSIGFLFMGFNVYASSLYTSLSNGLVSAVISFVRSLLLLIPLTIVLPALFGIDNVWWAVPVTELITTVMVVVTLYRLDGRYGYLSGDRVSQGRPHG